jgi:hypothetical protein
MTRKWVAINSLCDRQTVRVLLPFPAGLKSNARSETGENFPDHRQETPFGIRALLVLSLLIALPFSALPQGSPSEYQVKAAFLFNFAKFVEWPPRAFTETNSPIVIGVLGKNVFGNDLETTIRDKTVNNRQFRFKHFASATEATNCHILFISSSERDNLAKIVASLHHASVLTVSDTDGFIKAGGIVNFTFDGPKIRFEISDEAAKNAGLRVSSKLLSLAVPSH